MKIEGKKIANKIISHLKQEVKKLKQKPSLAVFLVEGDQSNISFVNLKKKAAEKIGAKFKLIHFKNKPSFEQFAYKLRSIAENKKTTAVIIQKPLPPELRTNTLYNYIPLIKEIEGHKKKTPFKSPIGLSVLTILKYIFKPENKNKVDNLLVDLDEDTSFFKNIFKRKSVVLIGKGETGGRPIGKTLTEAKINYIIIHSKTPQPELFYREADLIISAVGKKVIFPQAIKPGVVLINVGIRRDGQAWKGDYDEDEIKRLASFYTPTPGGIGPLDIAYLMYNLVQAAKMQQ